MGFKCPVCLKDFGKNKEEWMQHIATSHDGIGNDIVSLVKKITKPDSITESDTFRPKDFSYINCGESIKSKKDTKLKDPLKYLDRSYFDWKRYTGVQEIGVHCYLKNREILNPEYFEIIGYRLGNDIDTKPKPESFVVFAIMNTDNGGTEFWFHLFFEIKEDMEIASDMGIPIDKYIA